MSPYIVAGYIVTLVVLSSYALWLVSRERRARRRLGLRSPSTAVGADENASEDR